MPLFEAAPNLAIRYWEGESAAVVRRSAEGSTHLVGLEALAVLQALVGHSQGLALREIAHALEIGEGLEPDLEAGLQDIIDGLVQSGLLKRVDDSPDPGSEFSA